MNSMSLALLVTICGFGTCAFAENPKDPILVKKGQFALQCSEQREINGNLECRHPFILAKASGTIRKYFIVSSTSYLPNASQMIVGRINGKAAATSRDEICLSLGREPEMNGTESATDFISLDELTSEPAGLAAYASRSYAFIQDDLNTIALGADIKRGERVAHTIYGLVGCGAKLGRLEKLYR